MSSIPSIVVDCPFEDYEIDLDSHSNFVQVQALRNEIGESIIDDCLLFMNAEYEKRTGDDCEAFAETSGRVQSPDPRQMFVSVNNAGVATLKVWDARSYDEIQETYSSSSSRRSSYCSLPSPLDYQTSLEQNLENEFYSSLSHFPNWQDETCENFQTQVNFNFHDPIDNSDLNLNFVDEVTRNQVIEKNATFGHGLKNLHQSLEKVEPDFQVPCICDSESFHDAREGKAGDRQSESVIENSLSAFVNAICDRKKENSFGDRDICQQSNLYDVRVKESCNTEQSINSISNLITSPYRVLNLPPTKATAKLIAEVDPNDVMRAMRDVLKISTEDLTKVDDDGDTMLMCLVGNPEEMMKKKEYLLPLVERLSSVKGALSCINNHGKDALYLASINCPCIPEIAGYLAATLLQKGIDISQKLYHNKGDTLIHAVASKGDTHVLVLEELLTLKNLYGGPVFDLSKLNHDGKTALHLAVEFHDSNRALKTSVETVPLLLKSSTMKIYTQKS